MLRPLQVHISKCNVTASPQSPRLEAFPREHEPCNWVSRRPCSFVTGRQDLWGISLNFPQRQLCELRCCSNVQYKLYKLYPAYYIPYGPYVLYLSLFIYIIYICPSSMSSSKHVMFLSGFRNRSHLFSLGLQWHLRDAQRRQGHRLTQHRAFTEPKQTAPWFPRLHRNAKQKTMATACNGTLGKGLFMSLHLLETVLWMFWTCVQWSMWASSLCVRYLHICCRFHCVDPFRLFHEQNL